MRGRTVTTRLRITVKPYTDGIGQTYAPTVMALGELPGGGYVVLLHRLDLPDSPTLAVRLGTAR